MGGESDDLGVGDEHLAVGLGAQELGGALLPRVDGLDDLLQRLRGQGVLEQEEAVLVEAPGLVCVEQAKRSFVLGPGEPGVPGMG